jgi:nitroimidazol reductase NimA-like FMN-containing flavoprotein (pyridoxamine 5'-phosphate oxidase superfamily)
MTEQPNDARQPLNDVRRKDRQVTDQNWIRAMLHNCAAGALAMLADHQPFQHVNLFAFDEAAHAIYLHTARTGRTRTNIEGDGRVCFSVHELGRLLPADTALEMSVEYASVILFGRACVVNDPTEARHGLQLLLDKYFAHLHPGRDYRPITDEELARTAVYRIDIEQWSGKRKKVADDFPGAFTFPHHDPWQDR